ncbi:MAG: hypothetical protein H7833_08525 [Magnetococcus sp. DMHC-1]
MSKIIKVISFPVVLLNPTPGSTAPGEDNLPFYECINKETKKAYNSYAPCNVTNKEEIEVIKLKNIEKQKEIKTKLERQRIINERIEANKLRIYEERKRQEEVRERNENYWKNLFKTEKRRTTAEEDILQQKRDRYQAEIRKKMIYSYPGY